MRLYVCWTYLLLFGLFVCRASANDANKPTDGSRSNVSGQAAPGSRKPEATPPLPPGFVLDTKPNTSSDMPEWAIEQKRRELIALEKLNRVGFQSMSKEDLEDLPEETIKSLPAIELLAMGLPERHPPGLNHQTATMMVEFMLLELKYYLEIPTGKSSDRFVDAVKEFQKSIGAKPTGQLLMGEFDELSKRSAWTRPPKVRPYNVAAVYYLGDSAIVTGTWTPQDGTKNSPPLQTSRIELDRSSKRGVEAEATLWDMGDGNANLGITVNYWDILRWDEDQIIAEASSSWGPSSTMTIDIKTEKARMFRRPKGGRQDESKPRILEMSDGWNVSSAFWQEHQERAMQVMAPAYRDAMNRMRELMQEPPSGPNSQGKTPMPVPTSDVLGESRQPNHTIAPWARPAIHLKENAFLKISTGSRVKTCPKPAQDSRHTICEKHRKSHGKTSIICMSGSSFSRKDL